MSYFFDVSPNIEGNKKLRKPQIEAYLKIKEYFTENSNGEALVVLPTGTGKSGLISIAPYGVAAGRVLVITPGLVTKKSVVKTLHPLEDNFWINHDVFFAPDDIPVVEEYEPEMLDSSLEKCDFIITNVHKLAGSATSLLSRVSPDFFDMIIVDEAHHAVANSWQDALLYFSQAKKLHITGTPYRGDKQELPGVEIHNTPLAEVMALKYVKWLRKATVNNCELLFTLPETKQMLTIDQVMEMREKEWVEKSVALSKECSLDVIRESIQQLQTLKSASPKVPHKILAIACSVSHAEDLKQWYQSQGMKAVLVHSYMDAEQLETNFLGIENNACDVVVSVNMLMEGYDHKYLTILALFRPFRSLNAFAQVVGRVLRAIPDNEITDFAIDNNAIVVFHEETGLNTMWRYFQSEVERATKLPSREYSFTDKEYQERNTFRAEIQTGEAFIASQDSFLSGIDFNALFDQARQQVAAEVSDQIARMRAAGVDESTIQAVVGQVTKDKTSAKKHELDALLFEKRPELARKQVREFLYTNANEAVQAILLEKGIDPKATTLQPKFSKLLKRMTDNMANDGILVMFINSKLYTKFGPVKNRDPAILLMSQKYMSEVIDEIRRMI
jgi:superfamily II DNA or RNA helicase